MTKKQDVTKEAEALGIDVKKSWTIAEIESEIAKKHDEQVAKQREADREREARPNAITTSSIGIDPHDEDDEVEEPEGPVHTEDQDENKNNVKNLPNPTHDQLVEDDKVVVKYIREGGSYTIGRFRFSPNAPFRVVPKEFAEKHFFDGHPDVRVATPEEVKEYYDS